MSNSVRKLMWTGLLCMACSGLSHGVLADTIKVGGTGAATELLRRLGAKFAERNAGTQVEVLASLGSSGAIRAVSDGAIDVAVSSRALEPNEIAKGLTVALTFQTPFVFATSHKQPNGLTVSEIIQAFASPRAAWKDGSPMRVILRPRSESDTTLMGNLFPGLGAAVEQARNRPDVPLAATDQDNATMAEQMPGSLIGTSYTQMLFERRDLRLVSIDGVEPNVENFERGLYPYGKSLAFVVAVKRRPGVESFLAFVRSPEGEQLRTHAHSF